LNAALAVAGSRPGVGVKSDGNWRVGRSDTAFSNQTRAKPLRLLVAVAKQWCFSGGFCVICNPLDVREAHNLRNAHSLQIVDN